MSLQSLADVFAYVDAYVDTPEDKLTGNHVLVLNAIAHHTDQHGAGAYPTLPTLQRHTRLKRRTIQYTLRDLEAKKQVLKTVLQPGRYGRQTYQLLLPHVDIKKGAPPAPFDEAKDALPAPLENSKGAPPAPDPGLRSEERKNLAHAPEKGDTPEEPEELERPDDVLNRLDLDAATVANLETAARDALQAEGVKPFLQTTPVVHSYMVALWRQQQALPREGVATGADGLDTEEGQAHRATRAA